MAVRPEAYLLRGDARAIPLADRSVQCVVTSPPYWGLRDYGLPPSVWGGDDGCEHAWGGEAERATGHNSNSGLAFTGWGAPETRLPRLEERNKTHVSQGAVCRHCGAWRGTLGLEPQPELYVQHLVGIFREVRRVLRDDGVVFLNLGDSYASGEIGRHDALSSRSGDGFHGGDQKFLGRERQQFKRPSGLKPKDLVGIPWAVAFALRADGWYLRADVIWSKPNPMPESVTDRPTKSHEYLFLLAKSQTYFYDAEAIKEPHARIWDESNGGSLTGGNQRLTSAGRNDGGRTRLPLPHPAGRNRRSVWHIATQAFSEAHFAVMPRALVSPCILAGTSEKGACAVCGAPWERVTETTGYDRQRWAPGEDQYHTQAKGKHGATSAFTTGDVAIKSTTGWRPTCAHEAPTRPCIVLDPFSGAGTVAHVAKELGRVGVGVEPKPEYLAMAEERTRQGVLPL